MLREKMKRKDAAPGPKRVDLKPALVGLRGLCRPAVSNVGRLATTSFLRPGGRVIPLALRALRRAVRAAPSFWSGAVVPAVLTAARGEGAGQTAQSKVFRTKVFRIKDFWSSSVS